MTDLEKRALEGDRKLYEHTLAEYVRMRAVMRVALKSIEKGDMDKAHEILAMNLVE